MAHTKRVCIVGAGVAGLTSIKSCLENGITPVCYEMSSDIGGLWNTSERLRLGLTPQIYDSLITNISKVGSSFSDFPPSKDFPPFMTSKQSLDYLRDYAEHFELYQHITFETEITQIIEAPDYDETGNWVVRIRDLITKIKSELVFPAVIVATGQMNQQNLPDIPGLTKDFQGQVKFSGNFHISDDLKGKNVLVIGSGHSGCDIAVDCSKVAKNVFLSSRGGAWILPRIINNGYPLDIGATSRFKTFARDLLPNWLLMKISHSIAGARMNHEACGLQTKFPLTSFHATVAINDEIPIKIYTGQVYTRPGISKFDRNSVTFVDGREEDVDVVFVATGYTSVFKFIPKRIVPDELTERRLHFWIFPFEMKHPSTLCFVGLIPFGNGPVNSTVELQSRFIAEVLSGVRKLPSHRAMTTLWRKNREAIASKAGGNVVFKCGLFAYRDDLASFMGLIPSFFRLLFTDPKLAFNVYFGPSISYHYRLFGRHSWNKAREYSLNAKNSSLTGMKS